MCGYSQFVVMERSLSSFVFQSIVLRLVEMFSFTTLDIPDVTLDKLSLRIFDFKLYSHSFESWCMQSDLFTFRFYSQTLFFIRVRACYNEKCVD